MQMRRADCLFCLESHKMHDGTHEPHMSTLPPTFSRLNQHELVKDDNNMISAATSFLPDACTLKC